MSSRITLTKTDPFDMIVGLTETYLNANLAILCGQNPSTLVLQTHNIGGTIDATMSAPTVKIIIDQASGVTPSVIFTLHFTGGTINLNDVSTG